MMTHDEIRQELPDYALGLLPNRRLHVVETHLAQCSACRDALQVERSVGLMVHNALQVAAQADGRRLHALMPQPPQPRRMPWQRPGWQKQLAPIMIILMLIVGAFASQQSLPSGSSLPGFVSTAYAATATSTNTPTATAVAGDLTMDADPAIQAEDIVQDLAAKPTLMSESPPHTPQPLPTPISPARQALGQ